VEIGGAIGDYGRARVFFGLGRVSRRVLVVIGETVSLCARPRINGDETFAAFIGSANDVTDQKLAHENLESISGRLIEAQEKERSRIARELHDDISQRLALLSLELTQAIQASTGMNDATTARMAEIRQHCSEIADDVQALSHELHSSKLDYLGLVAATKSFCREFSQKQSVNVEFFHENVPSALPRDVSLSLFRIVQEALHNALKYSGVSRISVHLRGSLDDIQLEVTDAGFGFDIEETRRNSGLGLISMRERAHLVNGVFTIESKVNSGTRIFVRVPLVQTVKALATASTGF
jgi:signal transduction histidine kinase